jgi:hypothetical protein
MSGGKRILGSEFVAMTRVPPGEPVPDGFESAHAARTKIAPKLYV